MPPAARQQHLDRENAHGASHIMGSPSSHPDKSHPAEGRAMRVIGFELSGLDTRLQFALVVALTLAFNLVYGVLQEHLVVDVFERQHALFLSLLQTSSFTLFAYLQRLHLGEGHDLRYAAD
jgi:hypothetical protein